MNSSLLLAAATSLLTHIPVFLVWLVGGVVAVVRQTLSRRVAGFLIGGLATHFVVALAGTAVSVMLPIKLREGGASMGQVSAYLAIWSIAWSLISAAGWVLVLVAVFAGRQAAMPSEHGT
jgi:hypothetical protein